MAWFNVIWAHKFTTFQHCASAPVSPSFASLLSQHRHRHRQTHRHTDTQTQTDNYRKTDTHTHTDTALSSRSYFLWQISNFIDCKQMRYHVLWIVTCFMFHWKLSLCPVSNLYIFTVFLADWAGTVVRCLVSSQNFLLASCNSQVVSCPCSMFSPDGRR